MCSHTMEARWWTRLRLHGILEQAVLGGLSNQERGAVASDRATATGRPGVERGRGRRGRGSRHNEGLQTERTH
jgi:hypothetical protein